MSRVYRKITQQSDCPLAFFFSTYFNRFSTPPRRSMPEPRETACRFARKPLTRAPLKLPDGSHDVMISHRIHRNFVWTGVAIFTDIYFYQHVMFDFYRSSCTTVQWIGVMQHVFLILGAPMKSWVQSRVDETIWLMPSQQLTFGYFWLR